MENDWKMIIVIFIGEKYEKLKIELQLMQLQHNQTLFFTIS